MKEFTEKNFNEMLEALTYEGLDEYRVAVLAKRGGLAKYLLYQFYVDQWSDDTVLRDECMETLDHELWYLTNLLERAVSRKKECWAAYYNASTEFIDKPTSRELARWVAGRLIRAAEKEFGFQYSLILDAIEDLDIESEEYASKVDTMLDEIEVA